MNQIIRYGKVIRPSLGINVIDDRMTRLIEIQVNMKLNGILIADVITNSPAYNVGLIPLHTLSDGSIRLGDLITNVNGQIVNHVEDLLSAIEECKEGDIVTLNIIRFNYNSSNDIQKQSKTIHVTLTTRDKLQTYATNSNGFD